MKVLKQKIYNKEDTQFDFVEFQWMRILPLSFKTTLCQIKYKTHYDDIIPNFHTKEYVNKENLTTIQA